MAKAGNYRAKVLAAFDQFQASREHSLRNCVDALKGMYLTADAVDADQLPADPTADVRATFAKVNDVMRQLTDRIVAKLDAIGE